eukprot:297549-Amphidinium_carterae.1
MAGWEPHPMEQACFLMYEKPLAEYDKSMNAEYHASDEYSQSLNAVYQASDEYGESMNAEFQA